jgi:hypothetical protein
MAVPAQRVKVRLLAYARAALVAGPPQEQGSAKEKPKIVMQLIITQPGNQTPVCPTFLASGDVDPVNTPVDGKLFFTSGAPVLDANGNPVTGMCSTSGNTWNCSMTIPDTVAAGTHLLFKVETVPPGQSDQIEIIVQDCPVGGGQ